MIESIETQLQVKICLLFNFIPYKVYHCQETLAIQLQYTLENLTLDNLDFSILPKFYVVNYIAYSGFLRK